MRLKDKVAIITGASQGIGAAFAAGFAKRGGKDRYCRHFRWKQNCEKVADAGSDAFFVKTDVSKEPECIAMAKAASDKFGTIDILINNAAIFANIVLKPFMELSSEEFKQNNRDQYERCVSLHKGCLSIYEGEGWKNHKYFISIHPGRGTWYATLCRVKRGYHGVDPLYGP